MSKRENIVLVGLKPLGGESCMAERRLSKTLFPELESGQSNGVNSSALRQSA